MPVELKTGDYAEYWAGGPLRVFDRNGALLETIENVGQPLPVPTGKTEFRLRSTTSGQAKLTLITLGEPLHR